MATREQAARFLEQLGFGTRLRLLREWCGASHADLAEASGVVEEALPRYEAGTEEPAEDDAARLAEALHARISFLLRGEDPLTEVELTELRLQWHLDRMSPGQVAAVTELVDGILERFP